MKSFLQTTDEKFEEVHKGVEKLRDLLGHHTKGSHAAKNRFEAMLG